MQKDTYKSTGCFDLTCSGFVQTNKGVGLGGVIGPISTPLGQQYELNFGIYLVIISYVFLFKNIYFYFIIALLNTYTIEKQLNIRSNV
jgi:hypothetical protein